MKKERGAEKSRAPLSLARLKRVYCVKVNLPSLDHLLLGKAADIDEMSHELSIARAEEVCRPQQVRGQWGLPAACQVADSPMPQQSRKTLIFNALGPARRRPPEDAVSGVAGGENTWRHR